MRQWGIRLQVVGLVAMAAGALWRISRPERPLFEDLMEQVFTFQLVAWFAVAAIPYLIGYVLTLVSYLRDRPATRPVEHALLVAPWGLGSVLLLLAVLSGCRPGTAGLTPPGEAEYTVVSLGGQPLDSSAALRPPTLQLTSAEKRASGFAGCNRFSGTYTLSNGSFAFGPLALTRMACERGMEVETRFVEALSATRGYRVAGNRLTLLAGDSVMAELEAR